MSTAVNTAVSLFIAICLLSARTLSPRNKLNERKAGFHPGFINISDMIRYDDPGRNSCLSASDCSGVFARRPARIRTAPGSKIFGLYVQSRSFQRQRIHARRYPDRVLSLMLRLPAAGILSLPGRTLIRVMRAFSFAYPNPDSFSLY